MRLRDYYEYSKDRSRAINSRATQALRVRDWRKLDAKILRDFCITDAEVLEAIPAQRIQFLKHILGRALSGVDWIETEASYIRPFGFCLVEVVAFIEQNWCQSTEERERKKLVRTLALCQLLMTDWQSKYSDQMTNLKVTTEMVTQYADRMTATEFGRQKIIDQIVVGATNSNWREVHEKVMQTHRIGILEIESKLEEKQQNERMRIENSEINRSRLSKRRNIMSFLDVAEHPEFTPDELVEARTQAYLPEFKGALLDALIKKIQDGKRIHPNYYEYMRVQGISVQSVFEAARKASINVIINAIEVAENPSFKNRATGWHNSLIAIDSSLLTSYTITETDLEKEFRAALKGLVLRDVCLKKPNDDRWITQYGRPMQIAGLTEAEVRTHLSETENLDRQAIEHRFYIMLNSGSFAARKPLGGLGHRMIEFKHITNRFKALWQERHSQLGDISFGLDIHFNIDIGPKSYFCISIIRGADLLDSEPTVETEGMLMEALTKIAKQIESERQIYSWSGEHNFHAGLPIDIYDGDDKWPFDTFLP